MKYIAIYLLAVLLVIGLAVSTSQTGTLNAMVVPRQTVTDWHGVNLVTKEPITKAYINGEEVFYNAASDVRCDELYKNLHFVGYGNLKGSNQMVYLYRWNLEGYYVTVPELLAMYKDLKR